MHFYGASNPLESNITLSNHLGAMGLRGLNFAKPNASIDERILAGNDPDIEYSSGRYLVIGREGYGI